MQLYPAIDIKDGKCVRLKQGDFSRQTVFYDDPVGQAKKWEDAGATYIHIVDLDGARGTSNNFEAIRQIAKTVSAKIQTGGGIRTLADVEAKIELGISRVIIGTAAIENPEMVAEAFSKFGDKIAVGVDAVNGMVAVHGWETTSETTALDLCLKMKSLGVKTIIYTDISRDGMMTGPNIEATKHLIDQTGLDIIASGGVSCMEDLQRVSEINAEGVIIGKALYENAIDLKEAIVEFQN